MDNYKWNPDGWREYLNWVAQNKINIVEKIIILINSSFLAIFSIFK